MFALVDCNNFYASCERAFNPALRLRPVVVLSNNDGCIIARSEEAKALGIQMGTPEFKCRLLLRQHNVAVFSSNYALYGDMSSRVMSTLAALAPEIEVYSIDEAFLDMSSFSRFDLPDYARQMRRKVRLHGCASICTSRSFGRNVSTLAELQQAVATFAGKCAVKLRKEDSLASLPTVFIATARSMNQATATGEPARQHCSFRRRILLQYCKQRKQFLPVYFVMERSIKKLATLTNPCSLQHRKMEASRRGGNHTVSHWGKTLHNDIRSPFCFVWIVRRCIVHARDANGE